MKAESRLERRNKILLGLDKSYKKMLEFKKLKRSEVVILREGKIIRIKPE